MFLLQYKVPALLAVGLEGFWGLVICAIALPILSNVKGSDSIPLDSFKGAIRVRVLLLLRPQMARTACDFWKLSCHHKGFHHRYPTYQKI